MNIDGERIERNNESDWGRQFDRKTLRKGLRHRDKQSERAHAGEIERERETILSKCGVLTISSR